MAAAALVAVVWVVPLGLVALAAVWVVRRLRRPAAGVGLVPRPPAS
jgi:hypothetical protein